MTPHSQSWPRGPPMNDNLICTLEQRRLLSAAFASLSSHGTISVIGTKKNDSLIVQSSGTKVQAIQNGQVVTFSKSAVKRIWMNGFGGNDHLLNKTNLPSTLIGSSGDDTMVGGSGNDRIE